MTAPAAPIRYRIVPFRPEAHLYEVRCTVMAPDPQGQRFALPAWIPGSYMIREFARNIVAIRAAQGVGGRGAPVGLAKLDKHTWQAAPVRGPITVTCEIYAWEMSVRAAHLDTTHAFFNGTSVFLRVLGQEHARCDVEILPPPAASIDRSRYRNWEVATALGRKGAREWGFGRYAAADYDELIDHPVEMGAFTRASFRAAGVPHHVAITGRQRADMGRLARDVKRICETQIGFWNGTSRFGARARAGGAPMDRYVFLVTALGEGYGGLEHRASTVLVCARNDLPPAGMREASEAYRTFLGLVSHEYFHTWHVKRIKPAAFTPYDLDRENHTTLLWAFEGMTAYYDDLSLARAGLITHGQYLELLSRSITQLLRTPGRRRQTVSESSFDAWTKFYRQDENAPNAMVSYYGKGSLVALCLDLYIRGRTGGRKSLDDVMRALWRKYGRTGTGVPEQGIEELAESVSGLPLKRLFDRWLRSTAELPLAEMLATHGVSMALRPAEADSDKGGRRSVKSASALASRPVLGAHGTTGTAAEAGYRLTHVLEGSAAQRAGLAAGDVIIALDGVRVGSGGMDVALAGRRPGQQARLHAFRRDELMRFNLELDAPAADTCVLALDECEGAAQRLRARWLGKE